MAKLCSAMARPAQHRIELTEQERVELTRRARAEKLPFQEVQRARIVLYASEGMADTEIAGRLDTTAGIVGKWRRRFFDDRLEGLKDKPRAGRPRRFPPQQVAEVKAIACELPATSGLPLSKFSRVELHRLVVQRGVTDASASTIWRWLHEDAIKPWQTALVDLSARPRLCGEGRPGARPLRQNL